MDNSLLSEINLFVDENIKNLFEKQCKIMDGFYLKDIIHRNPFLLAINNEISATKLVESALTTKLYSSEEKMFGDFFERLAIYVAEECTQGQKSAARGVDIEFIHNSIHFVISVKSSTNWGNSSQRAKMHQDLANTVTRIKQTNRSANVQPVEGICYGKSKSTISKGILKVVGQNFWYLISGDKDLYKDIIEPIGYKAKEHNDSFVKTKAEKINLLTMQFVEEFCHADGSINWPLLVEVNCGNLDLDKMFSADQ